MVTPALFPFLLTAFPTVFWAWFFLQYSQKLSRSRWVLAGALAMGVCLAAIALKLELAIPELFPLFRRLKFVAVEPHSTNETLQLAALCWLFVAPIEELGKYLFLRFAIAKFRGFDPVADGLTLGMAVGLGFGTYENWLIFQSLNAGINQSALILFLLRLFGSTLAHMLYGAVLGYYIGQAMTSRIFKKQFLLNGLLFSILLHGFFDFFIFAHIGGLSLFMSLIVFVFMIRWYIDREDLLRTVISKHAQFFRRPVFIDRRELENTLLTNFPSAQLLQANICLHCFHPLPRVHAACPYCNFDLQLLRGDPTSTVVEKVRQAFKQH